METNFVEHKIRAAKMADLDQLYTMLVDLVKHEGLYERFKLTRNRLEYELFGKDADWNCIGRHHLIKSPDYVITLSK